MARCRRQADRDATGIVGSERGVLTNQLKDNPHWWVLLDVEKASLEHAQPLLQAFDEGWMTDGRGKRVI